MLYEEQTGTGKITQEKMAQLKMEQVKMTQEKMAQLKMEQVKMTQEKMAQLKMAHLLKNTY